MEKLFDSELKLMEIIWQNERISAKELSLLAAEQLGWNKNTTYTVIKRLIDKGALQREDPGFHCVALIKKEHLQKTETTTLIQKLFAGSKKAFFAALVDEELSPEDLAALKELIEKQG